MFLAINQSELASKKRKKENEKAEAEAAARASTTDSHKREKTENDRNKIITKPTGIAETDMKATTTMRSTTATPTPAAGVATTTTTTATKGKFIDNMLLEFSVTEKCKNCQHALQNVQKNMKQQRQQRQQHNTSSTLHPLLYQNDQNKQQQQQQRQQQYEEQLLSPLGRVPCHCDCDCVNKSFSLFNSVQQQSSHLPATATATATLSSSQSSSSSLSMLLPPKRVSLYTVYICLGTLTFALATLSMFFYSHVNNCATELALLSALPLHTRTMTATSKASATKLTLLPAYDAVDDDDADVKFAIREQFRRELVASDHVLRSIVARILQQDYSISNGVDGVASSDSIKTTTTGNNEHLQFEKKSTNSDSQNHGNLQHLSTTIDSLSLKLQNEENSKDLEDTTETIILNERKRNPEEQKRKRRDISSSTNSMHADPLIEFFNPNHRKALEEQDMEIRKLTGLKGAAPGGDEWIYLNTYCRVPEKIITGFCKSTQEYCPPGPQGPPGLVGTKGMTGSPGLPGIPGPKGNRGDIGLPGPPGMDGHIGPRGPKGDLGAPGRPGLDGRDGVPGEPGLDGVPGRAGADGLPGKDGEPGHDGRNGTNGKDGKDGASGPKGAQGPPGERGLKGIPGPRGRTGKAGINGTPGVPGVNTWKVQYHNGTFSTDLLIPPSITDINAPHIRRAVIVEEGKSLNLSCAATGSPMPVVEWRREDNRTINLNGIETSSVPGQYLKFNNITRSQMGAYNCFANNGIAPVASATYIVEVHFSPMISVYRQMIYAEYGREATLECLVEAFPEPIRYWERAYDGKILDPGDKYRIETYPDDYKTKMRLTINNLRKDDFGYYHCVARNEINATMVNFEIAPRDPNSETPYVGKEIKIYGQRPPQSQCPICEQCPEPNTHQCKDSINMNFEIKPAGKDEYPGITKRQKNCILYAIGKPVFHKLFNENNGAWLRDPAAKDFDREKTFVTHDNDAEHLYEFTTKNQFRLGTLPPKQYTIDKGFQGNSHVVYNNSFYYNQRNTANVVKMDLSQQPNKQPTIAMELPYAGIASGNKLYSTAYNYMDFNVDENGLWVIYSTYDSNNTLVAKLDADDLKIEYIFNITFDHHKFGEMFIVCGHLYAIDSVTNQNSQIRYVVDMFPGFLLNVDLPFTNPFRNTKTVGYNPYTVELYSWDKGNALTYPIRYHEKSLKDDHLGITHN